MSKKSKPGDGARGKGAKGMNKSHKNSFFSKVLDNFIQKRRDS